MKECDKEKKNHGPLLFMNINAKCFRKISANSFQHSIKNIIYSDEAGYFRGTQIQLN